MEIVEPDLRRAVLELLSLHLDTCPQDITHHSVQRCIEILNRRIMDKPRVEAMLAPYEEVFASMNKATEVLVPSID